VTGDTGRPRVSIVVPAFQAAATLDRALDSLLQQSFSDLEIIVVDDGSTDETFAVASRRAEADRRLRVLRQPNRGASAARNAGLAAVRGEWIGFLDSDDWFDREFLARLLGLLDTAPEAGVLYCDFALVDASGKVQEEQRVPDLSDAFGILARNCSLSVHCALTRADVMARAGHFDEALAINEDWDLWQRIARTGAVFRGVREILAFYHTRPNSLSRRRVEDLARDGITVIERMFRADPNIPAQDPRYANGLPAEEKLPIELDWLIMCAGNAIGLGIDPVPFLDLVPNLGDAVLIPTYAAMTMGGALAFARCVGISELAGEWETLEPRLDTFWAALAARVGQPRAIDAARLYIRRQVLGPDRSHEGFASDQIAVRRVDISAPLPMIDAGQCGSVVVELHDGATPLHLLELPAPAPIPPAVLAEAIAATAPYWPDRKRRLRHTAKVRLPVVALRTLAAGARARGWGLKSRQRSPTRLARALKLRTRIALVQGFADSITQRLRTPADRAGWEAALATIRDEEAGRVGDIPRPARIRAGDGEWREVEVNSREYWDQVFETENPWAYDSPYEQVKYEQTLSLVPREKAARAIELACAEGHFSAQLAPLVGELLATDISQKAIERAAERCAALDNVRFAQLDFFNDPVPGEFDLIVCSEVLYEAKSREKLSSIARNIADHLAPGGALVTAHIVEAAEERDRSGFDWGGVFGSKSITDALLATGKLQLEEELEAELYRVQRFRRSDAPIAAIRTSVEMGAPPERDYAFHVVWGGAKKTWAEVAAERALAVPILMYHRIAERHDGPADLAQYRVSPAEFEAQLRWLRQNGYHGITPAEWRDAVDQNRALTGRPVMLTFDDGYRDFATAAWPILGRFGIPATVAVVTDRIGGGADWDARFGSPAQLMSWEEVQRVSAEGAHIASHSASHPALTGIGAEETLREAFRSHAAIERAVGIAPDAVVYPYGIYDPVAARAFAAAGFTTGFGTRTDTATMLDDPMHLPRIDVSGFDTLDTFIANLTRTDLETGVTKAGSAA
jgi:glycosyltransferase involved in cell wall biosynthesis/peptidoglycan/xylan/chitin deacetylase (PgdA/CDA1 family)/protein-L-isoaspartate O-methyltransferase